MKQIDDSSKERIIRFINENELDFEIVDNGIIRFHLISEDRMLFYFYTLEDKFIILKEDPSKHDNDNPFDEPFKYHQFKTLSEALEQLKLYDDNIPKSYWNITPNAAEIPFIKDSYNSSWYDYIDISKEECCEIKKDNNFGYDYLVYSNDNYKPELKSPYNTLHEVSPINDIMYTKIDKLYFEIHPISCEKKRESYLLKLQCNNEETLKEFINYIVSKEKGLKMLIESIFTELEKYKIKNC